MSSLHSSSWRAAHVFEYASDPVLVHRLARLLHASFRRSLAVTPLRFAITSLPSGCEGDLHPRVVEHARHTKKSRRRSTGPPGPRLSPARASPIFACRQLPNMTCAQYGLRTGAILPFFRFFLVVGFGFSALAYL